MEGEDLVCNFKKCRKRLNSFAYVSLFFISGYAFL